MASIHDYDEQLVVSVIDAIRRDLDKIEHSLDCNKMGKYIYDALNGDEPGIYWVGRYQSGNYFMTLDKPYINQDGWIALKSADGGLVMGLEGGIFEKDDQEDEATLPPNYCMPIFLMYEHMEEMVDEQEGA